MALIGLPDTVYTSFQRNGVICLSISALISFFAIVLLLIFKRPKQREFGNGHIFGYFYSLMASNAIQAIGTIMNFVWVGYNAVEQGAICNLQGGIKNFGNISNALWSLMLSIQLFNLLFLKWHSTKWGFWASLLLGWLGCLILVIIGPAAIQKPGMPSYFGPAGAWCWIGRPYKIQQIFLEYFLQYLSIGISFVLYIFIIMRIRGNLVISKDTGKWTTTKVSSSEAWKVKDEHIDVGLIRVARVMVWFPIAYMFLLLPISITRFIEWSGTKVPFETTIMTDIIFSLMGAVNVLLILYVHHLFPTYDPPDIVSEKKRRKYTFDPRLMVKGDPYASINNTFRSALFGRSNPQKESEGKGHKREKGVYIPYPERAHFPAFTRKMSAESNASDESFGNDPKDIV